MTCTPHARPRPLRRGTGSAAGSSADRVAPALPHRVRAGPQQRWCQNFAEDGGIRTQTLSICWRTLVHRSQVRLLHATKNSNRWRHVSIADTTFHV